MPSRVTALGPKPASSAGPYAVQLCSRGRRRAASQPASTARPAAGSVYASSTATCRLASSSQYPSSSHPAAAATRADGPTPAGPPDRSADRPTATPHSVHTPAA